LAWSAKTDSQIRLLSVEEKKISAVELLAGDAFYQSLKGGLTCLFIGDIYVNREIGRCLNWSFVYVLNLKLGLFETSFLN